MVAVSVDLVGHRFDWGYTDRVWLYNQFITSCRKAGLDVRMTETMFKLKIGTRNEFLVFDFARFVTDQSQPPLLPLVKDVYISYLDSEGVEHLIRPAVVARDHGKDRHPIGWAFETGRLSGYNGRFQAFTVDFGDPIRYIRPKKSRHRPRYFAIGTVLLAFYGLRKYFAKRKKKKLSGRHLPPKADK